MTSWSTCRAISRRWIQRACAWSSRRWPTRTSISAPWWCRSAMRSRRQRCPSSRPPARSTPARPSPRRSISPVRRFRGAWARAGIMSGSMPTPSGARPLCRAAAKPAGAARKSGTIAGAGEWNADRLRTDGTRPVRGRHRRGPGTRPRDAEPAHDGHHDDRLPGRARRLLRPGLPQRLSGDEDPALPVVRGRDRRGARGHRHAGDAAVREQPGRPGIRHPLICCRIPACSSSASSSSASSTVCWRSRAPRSPTSSAPTRTPWRSGRCGASWPTCG